MAEQAQLNEQGELVRENKKEPLIGKVFQKIKKEPVEQEQVEPQEIQAINEPIKKEVSLEEFQAMLKLVYSNLSVSDLYSIADTKRKEEINTLLSEIDFQKRIVAELKKQ